MGTEQTNTTLQTVLKSGSRHKGLPALEADVEELFHKLDGEERVEAIISRVQRYAVEAAREESDGGLSTDFSEMHEHEQSWIKRIINNELAGYVSWFITDKHREFVVRGHARGLSTGEVVRELMNSDNFVVWRLSREDAVGWDKLRDILIHRLSYLKPGTARWPEKKYGKVWREAREQYRQAIRDMPFTSQVEQVRLLATNAERLHRKLQDTPDPKEIKMLTSALNETIRELHKLSPDEPATTPVNLFQPQLVAVLERLTIALNSPQMKAIEGESKERVGALVEQLTLALNLPQQVDGDNGTKSLPAKAGADESKAK